MPTTAMPEIGRDQGGNRRTALLVLLSLPFLLAAIGYGWSWEIRYQEGRTQHEQHLRGILTAWSVEAVPETALRRLLQAAEREILLPGASLRHRQAVLRGLHRRFPNLFTFYVMDSRGCPVPELCDKPQPKVAWQRVDAAYRTLLNGDPAPFQRLSTSVHSLLGGFIPLGRPLAGALLRADADRKRRWLFVGAPHPEGWFLAHLTATTDWLSLPLKDRIQRWNRRSSATRFFLVQGAPPDFSQSGLATAPLKDLWESLEPVTWRDDTLWGLRRVAPRLTLVASRKTDLVRNLRQEVSTALIALVALWLVTLGAGFNPYLAKTMGASSIRLRLILAVGFAAALPFITISVVTLVFVREHGLKLEGDLFFRMEGALRDMDDLAPILVEQQNAALLRGATALSWPAERPDLWEENLRRLRPVAPWDLAKIYGPSGHCLFTNASHSSLLWSPEDLGFFENTARQYLRRLRVKDPAAPVGGKERGFSFLESTIADMADQLGSLTEFTAGEERLFIMYVPLMEESRIKSLLLLLWNRWRLERDFLQKHLPRFARDLPDTRLLVWRPDTPNRWLPSESPLWKTLRPLFSAIRDQTGCFQGHVLIDGEPALVAAIRADAFPGSFLVSVTSSQSIQTELWQAIYRVAGVGLLLAFGGALAALIFARSFLRPISLLGGGINALRVHDFSIRLPQAGKDELGQLTSAFNRMAEGLEDLKVAQSVQETLYPSSALDIPPFSIRGGTTSQSGLGGQAFDYGLLDNQEVGFLIGTCRASGVTAGLALALAKGVLSHPRTSPDPAQALLEMEQTIAPILGPGVSLEILYGRLDRVAGTIRLAGRSPHPPLLMWDGKGRFLYDPSSQPPGSLYTSGILPFPNGSTLLLLSGGPRSRAVSEHFSESNGDSLLRPLFEKAGEPMEAAVGHLLASLEKDPWSVSGGDSAPGEQAREPRTDTGWTFLLVDRARLPKGEGSG